MTFTGLSAAGIDFYDELELDNAKAFWTENKHRYESEVKAPMAALGEELSDYGPFRLFRPYNDVRFSKGKPLGRRRTDDPVARHPRRPLRTRTRRLGEPLSHCCGPPWADQGEHEHGVISRFASGVPE